MYKSEIDASLKEGKNIRVKNGVCTAIYVENGIVKHVSVKLIEKNP